jgi:hypothetical protein
MSLLPRAIYFMRRKNKTLPYESVLVKTGFAATSRFSRAGTFPFSGA